MALEDIYYVGQTIAVVALVLSLVFVGVQVRQNTNAASAASHGAVSEALNEVNRLFAENAEVTGIWLSGMKDRQALSEDERWRFDAIARAYFHVCETMLIQARLGTGDRGVMMAEESGIKPIMASRGVNQWWTENPFGFCPDFRAHIDALTTGKAS